MATPILDIVSKDLAYKLQDPVSAGTANGIRLSAAERFRYIIRAYRRFLRIVTTLYPTLIQQLFQSYYKSTTGTTDSTGKITTLGYAEVFDLYCKEPSDEDYFRAEFISPDIYIDVETGQNSFYQPDLNTDRYYWSRQGPDIVIIPAITLNYKVMYRDDVASNMESGGQGGTYDIDIPTEYLDILLSFATAEAYMDIGQTDMVQLYKADAIEQLSILNNVSQKKEKDDDEGTA